MKTKEHPIELETERLIIRPLNNQDYEKWLEGFLNRLPSQRKYDNEKADMSAWTEEKFNQEVVSLFDKLARQDEVYVFGIFRKADQKHLGKVEICTIMRDEFQWGLLGYTIHNQYWQRGYGKEAVNAVLKIAFENLHFHRIEAHINMDNVPSIRLAESVGMEFECVRKGFIYELEEWTDHLIYYKNFE